jgi:hypothetical protein
MERSGCGAGGERENGTEDEAHQRIENRLPEADGWRERRRGFEGDLGAEGAEQTGEGRRGDLIDFDRHLVGGVSGGCGAGDDDGADDFGAEGLAV